MFMRLPNFAAKVKSCSFKKRFINVTHIISIMEELRNEQYSPDT